MTEPKYSVFRFSDVEVHERELQLKRGGAALPVEPKAFRVLMHLLRNPGRLIRKDELLNAGWGDTAVTDNSLTRNIALLRRLLDDDIHAPRYIETVSTVGYRFICPVEAIEDSTVGPEAAVAAGNSGGGSVKTVSPIVVPVIPAKSEVPWRRWLIETLSRRGYRFIGKLDPSPQTAVPVALDQAPHTRQTRLRIAAGILALTVLAVGLFVVFRWSKRDSRSELESLTSVPFTTFPGQETAPAISPDGSRIAFSWNGDPGSQAKGFDLYVKAIGSETLLRLTHHPATWISSAWSSDGTQIAFHRSAGADSGIYVVPALGGPERKLVSTVSPRMAQSSLSIISWSPDGKWIGYSDELPGKAGLEGIGTFFLSTDTLESRRLANPPNCISTASPMFSHNGEYLAFWCLRSTNDFGLYSVTFPSGEPRMIATLQDLPSGLTWSGDDKRLIYSGESPGELIDVSIADGSFRRLAFAGNSHLPTVSQRGDKLAYSLTSSSVASIWRRDLLHPESPAVQFVPSTRSQYDAQFSPDGKQIAFVSHRSGVQGVWVSGEDGGNLVQISNPRYRSGSPQWSPDGRKIAFDSMPSRRWEIYVADLSAGIPRKLTTDVSDIDIGRPHWSRDGKWIYFMSDGPGRMGVFRCPSEGGDAIALSKDNAGTEPQDSFDGGTIYYASGYNKPMLKRVTQQRLPGTASEVDGLPRVLSELNWTPVSGGIYFVPADSPRSLRYFDLATKQIKPVFEVDKDFNFGLSASSDGRWVLYSQDDKVNGDIMLVDHFH